MMPVTVGVCKQAYLNTYPRRTPFSWGSGGGCHWTIMDWLVRPLATIFLGGALGGSSLSINLTRTIREKWLFFTRQTHIRIADESFSFYQPAWTVSAQAGVTVSRSSEHVCGWRAGAKLLVSHLSSCDQFLLDSFVQQCHLSHILFISHFRHHPLISM